MNQLPSNTANARNLCDSAQFPKAPGDSASLLEQQRWEREVFFQPCLVEAERRTLPKGRQLGLLLAMAVGIAGWSAAFAGEQDFTAATESDQSSEATLTDWLIDVFTNGDNEESPSDSLKSGETKDPDEGDPK